MLRLTSDKRIRSAVASGRILHAGHGRYALPVTLPALAAAARLGGHASHVCAAMSHGWEVAEPPISPQVVLRSVLDRVRGVEVFRYDVRPGDADGLRTGPLLTVLLCARDLPFGQALAVADSALRHGDLDPDALVGAASGWPERVKRVAAYADGRAANPFESVLRSRAIEAGARVVPQWAIEAQGLVLHPDLADPFSGLAIEGDSWGFHAGRWEHDRDCRRYNALTATGWRVLRFTYEQVMGSPDYVRQTIRRSLDQ